ncbi:hypothetical protein [Tranquillimonas alkanivorans]|uniref:Uncharacterized protein n=1 Tax=Tranquillimonas alkanivorans TaxID=441119 RepID=A0A1I5W0N7_9RHOB|nr:hypothetical protein [Tranquillimonas alkanivorans]SFQ13250.1 hypothetical protein SAMN04488047_13820 [Tranquillimonas alkanivorans]
MTVEDTEAVSHLRQVIQDFADEIIFAHAVEILKVFTRRPFLNITGDYFHWPYAGEKSRFSFSDEIFWVMKHEHVPELAIWGYQSEINAEAHRLVRRLSDAEERFLIEACWPEDIRSQTHPQMIDTIVAAIQRKVFAVVRDHDAEILESE